MASDMTVRAPRTCVANSAFASTFHGEAQNTKEENPHFPFPKQLPNTLVHLLPSHHFANALPNSQAISEFSRMEL